MRTYSYALRAGFGLLFFCAAGELHADVTIRVSVKFIDQPDGTRPSAGAPIDISTAALFGAEIVKGNNVLATTERGYRVQVVEYLDIRPFAPPGQASDYWFNLPARSNRQTIETAALADQTTWRWRTTALNIYVNNSSSGQCSFVGGGSSIALGASIFTEGTVIHEIGHFFDLRHTHSGDPTCSGPPYSVADGDDLAATIADHNCLDRDGLSQANFGRNYSALTGAEQVRVNTSWLNVMSYHVEDILLREQMDIWSTNANLARLVVCDGRTWFVASAGSDAASGQTDTAPFATLTRGLNAVTDSDDVVLLRAGTYIAPVGNRINTPCTLRATRGPVSVVGN